MKMNIFSAGRRATADLWTVVACGLVLGLAMTGMRVKAQDADAKKGPATTDSGIDKTVFLNNATQQNDLNDIQTMLRNMFTKTRIYGLSSQHAISIHGSPEEVSGAEKMVAELDRPRPSYRLTMILTGGEGAKGGGARTFTLIAGSGEKTVFKQGGRVPIVTGHYDGEATAANSQVQYMDVGLTIEVTAVGVADGVGLRLKVEQSGVSEEKSGVGVQDPVFQQEVLEGATKLTFGKPQVLGSIEDPGTGQKREISVVAELVK